MKSTQKFFPAQRFIIYILLLFVFLMSVDTAAAQEPFWEGRISAAPYGLLPSSGMYAASNAFPLDSKVLISTPESTSLIEVRVVERLDVDRVFMQLSPEAARQFGLKANEILIARVSPVRDDTSAVEKSLLQESPYSKDPDINPSTAANEGRLSLIQEYLDENEPAAEKPREIISQKPSPDETTAEPPVEVAEAIESEYVPAGPSEIAEVPAQPETGEPAARETLSGSAVVHAIPDRTIEPEELEYTLPPPDRKTEGISVAAEPSVQEDAPEVPASADSAEPRIVAMEPIFPVEKDYSYIPSAPDKPASRTRGEGPVISMDSAEPSSDDPGTGLLARHAPELPKTEAPMADLGSVEDTEAAGEAGLADAEHQPVLPGEEIPVVSEIPEDAELVLVPAEERPPEGPPAVVEEVPDTSPSAEGPARTRVSASTSLIGGPVDVRSNLENRSYYLQVGAYNKLESARNNAVALAPGYPVMIYTEKNGAAPYKLMIGPLNEDESDTLLYTLSSRGYPDAFVRRGN